MAARVMGCEYAGLFLPDESGFGPVWYSSSTPDEDLVHLPRVALGDGVLGRTASRGRYMYLRGSTFDELDVPRSLCEEAQIVVEDAVCVPLVDGANTTGALALVNLRGADHRDEEADEKLSVLLSAQIARAVTRNAQRRDAQLTDRLMTIGQMLSSVLHDLKGPMTVISGYSQLMAQIDDGAERAEMAESIRRQVHQFNDMTREVMAYVRGERRVFARKVYLQLFVDAVTEVLEPEFDGGEVLFVVENEARNRGYFDERKMMRVVTNIARNARQAMKGGGTVKWVLSDVSDGGVLFRIEDNGPGIPESIRDTLFEAFTTSGKPEGTGLGLAIVRRIVEDHGGSVSFTTRTGAGTCFNIRLPGPPEETMPPAKT